MIGGGFGALARQPGGLYLNIMAQPVSTPQQIQSVSLSQRRATTVIAMGALALGVVLLLGALALWFHYGTTVFFETISSGLAGCF